ncbi:hypothetical protein [Methanoculleus chikugoensis]|uniref:hypothetical protein n=1 Tax=Methanoculleus chikugoensis TaxID=118126 RepID=UPI000A69969B|nr:hypothetical protein [Methanoculleus chikugoensis]
MTVRIPFDNLSFSVLTEDIDVSSFRCGEPDLTEFLIEDALENQAARLSVTRLVSYEGRLSVFSHSPTTVSSGKGSVTTTVKNGIPIRTIRR